MLSDEDYQSYIDTSNQLANVFPEIVAGYDAQGNAILNIGNNAATAAKSLNELYDASLNSSHIKIGEDLQDAFDGIKEQIKVYSNDRTDLENSIEKKKMQ